MSSNNPYRLSLSTHQESEPSASPPPSTSLPPLPADSTTTLAALTRPSADLSRPSTDLPLSTTPTITNTSPPSPSDPTSIKFTNATSTPTRASLDINSKRLSRPTSIFLPPARYSFQASAAEQISGGAPRKSISDIIVTMDTSDTTTPNSEDKELGKVGSRVNGGEGDAWPARRQNEKAEVKRRRLRIVVKVVVATVIVVGAVALGLGITKAVRDGKNKQN